MRIYTFDWFKENIPVWERVLKDYRGKEDLNFLEIGAFEGMSTNWFLDNVLTAPTARLTVIDTFEGSMESEAHGVDTTNILERFTENTKEHGKKITALVGYSQDILRENILAVNFDCIYIDGSHKASDVIEDIVLSWHYLKAGGILILDDYDWRFYKDELLLPKPAIDAFLALYAGQYELLEKNMQVIVKKI